MVMVGHTPARDQSPHPGGSLVLFHFLCLKVLPFKTNAFITQQTVTKCSTWSQVMPCSSWPKVTQCSTWPRSCRASPQPGPSSLLF
eukprot:1145878-Pelagomonas_calceolata.AAC.2